MAAVVTHKEPGAVPGLLEAKQADSRRIRYGRIALPIAANLTLNGVAVALVAMFSAASTGRMNINPVNLTVIVHDAPAARLAGQSFVCAN